MKKKQLRQLTDPELQDKDFVFPDDLPSEPIHLRTEKRIAKLTELGYAKRFSNSWSSKTNSENWFSVVYDYEIETLNDVDFDKRCRSNKPIGDFKMFDAKVTDDLKLEPEKRIYEGFPNRIGIGEEDMPLPANFKELWDNVKPTLENGKHGKAVIFSSVNQPKLTWDEIASDWRKEENPYFGANIFEWLTENFNPPTRKLDNKI